MNLSWANQIAKSALKTAQQKIDSVLDIRTDEENAQSTSTVVLDDPLLTPVPSDVPTEDNLANIFAVPDTGQTETWGSAWGGLPSDPELVVDSEPNPIRDDDHNVTHLLDHSPSSNSSDAVDSHGSPTKSTEYIDVDLVEEDKEHDSTITCEPLLPPHHETSSLAGFHQDDSLTVASSDIEVIRNVDAWSVSSSRITNDHMPIPTMASKEATAALEAQLQHAEQRRNELKASNDVLHKSNIQLQQRIVILNQHQNTLKKELEDKTKECEDVLAEGKKMSDYSGKQSREIRRLKSELSDLEKIKAERKRFKDEKTQAEETIELQKEEVTTLKNMIKTLESSSEQIKKESTQNQASNEVVQKHIETQDKRLTDMESEVKRLEAEKHEMDLENRELKREVEQMHAAQWADRLAGERTNEKTITLTEDLSEAREQIERLTSQLNYTRTQLEHALDEQSSIAETIAKSNAPLLEELSELKIELANERQVAEECDKKARHAKKECDDLKKQLTNTDEKHVQRLSAMRTEIESMVKKHSALESDLSKLRQEREREESEFKNTRKSYEERMQQLHNDLLQSGEEANNLRKTLKEFKADNDDLRFEVSELRKVKEVGSAPSPVPNVSIAKVDSPTDMPIVSSVPKLPPMSYTFANSGQAAQVELEALSCQYESSLKRIAQLEGESKRTMQLEIQIKTLQRELKELNHHYNQLLELDGERLEKLEEQAQDIIDLRHLLKEQLLAFAEAKSREEDALQAED